MNSLIMTAADAHKVPAGGALAVDREGFAACVTKTVSSQPLITCCAKKSKDCRRETGTM